MTRNPKDLQLFNFPRVRWFVNMKRQQMFFAAYRYSRIGTGIEASLLPAVRITLFEQQATRAGAVGVLCRLIDRTPAARVVSLPVSGKALSS
jgi:hypothetical protein